MGIGAAIGYGASILIAGGSAVYSANRQNIAAKDAKSAAEQKARDEAELAKQAEEAEAQATIDAKESVRLEMENRKRASLWKTRDLEEEDDDLGKTKRLGATK